MRGGKADAANFLCSSVLLGSLAALLVFGKNSVANNYGLVMAESINWEEIALRRAKFLLDEANSCSPKYDQTVRFALRVISNVATVGKDCGSGAIKWINPNVSEGAWELYRQLNDDVLWHRSTTNEHPEPLNQVWQWIRDHRAQLTPDKIVERLKDHPMVTVARHEDEAINKRGLRSRGDPKERHRDIVLGPKGPPKRRSQFP